MSVSNLNHKTLVFIAIFAVAGCGNKNIETTKKVIEERLVDPSSVQYRNVAAYSEDVVCGEVNAKNKMGGYGGYKSFIFNGVKRDEVALDPSSIEMAHWCNNNKQKLLTYFEKELGERSKTLASVQKTLADREVRCSDQSLSESQRMLSCYEANKFKPLVEMGHRQMERAKKKVDEQKVLSKSN